jgi:hypothetical protein
MLVQKRFKDGFIYDLDYEGLMLCESKGYIVKCHCCNRTVSSVVSEVDRMFSYNRPVAVAVETEGDEVEMYCKKCYDKICC